MLRKIPIIVVAIYLILVVLSVIPIFTGDGPLSGIFAVVLAAPWTNLLGSLLPGNLVTGLLVVALGAAINAAIIYFVLRWLVGRVAK
jgi:hypothetical protein